MPKGKINPAYYKPENLTRRLDDVMIRAVDGSDNRFEISFSSETPCRRWGEDEILLHGADNVSLDRLRTTGVLLFAHGRNSRIGTIPIGGIVEANLDETARKCTAVIELDEDDETAMMLAGKIRKGYLTGISVGCRVNEWTILQKDQMSADGRFRGPVALGSKWEPYEISIEPIPADSTVGIGRSMEGDDQMENEMERTVPAAAGETGAQQPPAGEAVSRTAEDAVAAERQRVMEITQRCGRFGIDPADYIRRGLTVDAVNGEILRTLERRSAPVTVPAGTGVTDDELDKFRRAASGAMLLRGGIQVEKPAEGASELRSMRLRDVAVECATRSGVTRANRMDDTTLMRTILTPDSAFVGIVNDTVRASMQASYAVADTTYQLWTSKASNTDFKPALRVQISEAGDLDEITQNGELKMDHPGDTGVTSVLATFGKRFGFTRKALINDDIGVLTSLPAAYVRAAKRGVNKAVYKILQANPTMADGKTLFSTDHGNLGTGAKPTTASYQEAMGKMMHQKGLRGIETLNIRPKFVICDPLQYADHAAMLRSLADPSSNNAGRVNPFNGMMELVMDADLLANTSGALPYYFAADPTSCGTIEVAYLNGQEEPLLDWRMGFDFLGIEYRIIHDRGVTLLDYRGLVKNPGQV